MIPQRGRGEGVPLLASQIPYPPKNNYQHRPGAPSFSRTLRKGWDSTTVSRMGFSEPHDLPFSSHFSCTPLTDTQSQSCENSRECTIENCARLQRRTHPPPKNHFRRLFDNVKTSSISGDPAPRKVYAKPQNPPLSHY